MNYPFGPLLKMLILTGQRRSEVGEVVWSEFDLAKGLWDIPAERMKAKSRHVLPLTTQVQTLLASLPRYVKDTRKGDFVFSTTFGRVPVSGYSKTKERLDKLMLAELRRLAKERGADPEQVKLPPFNLQDIRRTVRTRLSALPVSDLVRELVIAHSKPQLHKVYDQHAYLEEKRQALELWENALVAVTTKRGEPP